MSEIAQRKPSRAQRAYRFVNRPYYWYRPSQLALRLRSTASPEGTLRLVRTAWGSRLHCWPDPLGQALARTGVYDLVVAETLARLADPGETAVDAGANVGVMSNLLAHAVGADGRVVAYEPHPLIFETLQSNVSSWRRSERLDTIDVRQAALSSAAGVFALAIDPHVFAGNKGTASLEQTEPDPRFSTDVEAVRLADELPGPIGVLKLDVERHELAALRGAEALLAGKLIRDIVFEELEPPPTPVTTLLQAHGYAVFGIRQGPIGPALSTPTDAHRRQLWDPPALLATIDPDRARRRLKRRGWSCLNGDLRGPRAL